MATTYRQARSDDVPEMADVFLDALGDMCARFNIVAAPPTRQTVYVDFAHRLATGFFYLAEVEGQIAAIASAIVRDHLWFLASFWVRPVLQRQGIGMPLLKMVWNAGKEAGATTFFVWSSSDDAAMSSYLKLGMHPGCQILRFEGVPRQLPSLAPAYTVARLEQSYAMQLDREIVGIRRPADHHFWSHTRGLQGRQVQWDGEVVGYYYLDEGGIGPLAWRAPRDAAAVLSLACREAAQLAPQIHLAVPGINHSAIRFAFDAGLRLKGFSHFLTTAPFGRLEQYLPSGPALF